MPEAEFPALRTDWNGSVVILAGTVLFDLDGVLLKGDSFALFMRREAATGWRRVTAFLALLAVAPLTGVPTQRSRAIRFVVRAGLLGLTEEEFRRRARLFGAALAREPGRVLRDGVAAAHRHVALGDRVVVVTASEHTLARSFLDALGLATVELVASRAEGRRIAVHNRGEEKVWQLAARGITAPWEVAYSDSLTDLPMLRGAERAVLVNATPRALALARAALGYRVTAVTWA
jgi:phosphatidylglycerophosphatase C